MYSLAMPRADDMLVVLRAAGVVPSSEAVMPDDGPVVWHLDEENAAHLAWLHAGGRQGDDARWWRLHLDGDWPAPLPKPGAATVSGMVWEPRECVEGGGHWRRPHTLAEVWEASTIEDRTRVACIVAKFLTEQAARLRPAPESP